MLLYHGSPHLFDHFELTGAGKGTGIKYGHGVYLTESEASAVHYSQPRHAELSPKHYLYTVEIPDLTDDNHLISAKPVTDSIIHRVEARLGTTVPEEAKNAGKKLRKWIGTMLTGAKKSGPEEEKRAAEFLDCIGVIYNVWPTAQTKPDGPKNIAVFEASHTRIVKVEEIEIEQKSKKWVLKNRKPL